MKKNCGLIIALSLLSLGASAQSSSTTMGSTKTKTVRIAPEAGFNLNNMYMRSKDFQTSNMLKAGFHAGLMVDAALGKHLSFQPGVRYIMKGSELTSKYSTATTEVETKDKLTLHYIEVPLNLAYKFGQPGEGRFMIGAGPYIAYLANAQDKSKVKTSTFDGAVVETIDEGQHSLPIGHHEKTGNLRRIDAGAGAFVGYETAMGIYAKAGASIGLIDLQKSNIDGKYYNQNYNFLLTVGYLIGSGNCR